MDLGRWNMRQKPTGAFKAVLRAPVWLYRWRLGFLLGERFLLITHVGRKSGRVYRTPVEVVEHDRQAGEYIVCSGTGPSADWYLNLRATPAREITVGTRCWQPEQRLLGEREAAEHFQRYEQQHPRTARALLATMGQSYDGTDLGRVQMMRNLPMVAFSDRSRPAAGPPRAIAPG